jgi:hypothetical protein
MSWNPEEIKQAPDGSSYLGLWDSAGTGNPISGGASYVCVDTGMAFMLDLPVIAGKYALLQSTQVSFPFGDYAEYQAQFTSPVQPGSLLIAIFTSEFQSSLFNVAISDSTFLGWTAPFPTDGHVPGESNSLQVFLAISVGGQPIVTVERNPLFSDMTNGSLILLEYSGPNGTIAEQATGFLLGGGTITLGPLATSPGDLMLLAVSIMPACPNPDVQTFGGGFVAQPPTSVRIQPNSLPVVSLPFCFTEKCRLFD